MKCWFCKCIPFKTKPTSFWFGTYTACARFRSVLDGRKAPTLSTYTRYSNTAGWKMDLFQDDFPFKKWVGFPVATVTYWRVVLISQSRTLCVVLYDKISLEISRLSICRFLAVPSQVFWFLHGFMEPMDDPKGMCWSSWNFPVCWNKTHVKKAMILIFPMGGKVEHWEHPAHFLQWSRCCELLFSCIFWRKTGFLWTGGFGTMDVLPLH